MEPKQGIDHRGKLPLQSAVENAMCSECICIISRSVWVPPDPDSGAKHGMMVSLENV